MTDADFNMGDVWLQRDFPGTMVFYEQLMEDGHDFSYGQVVHGLRKWCKQEGYSSITALRQAISDGKYSAYRDPVQPDEVEAFKVARRQLAKELIDNLPDVLKEKPENWPATPLLYRTLESEDRKRILLRIAELSKQVMADIDPIPTHFTYRYDTDRPIAILWAGCMHMGGRFTDHAFVERQINEWPGDFFFLGDEIEGFSPSWFNQMSLMDQPLSVNLQTELFDLYLDGVAGRTKGGVWSQHGHLWFEKDKGYSPIKERYLRRGIPFFEGTANLTFVVGEQVYKIVASHNFPGSSIYNANHKHVRALRFEYPNADVLIDGDKHFYSAQERNVYVDEYRDGTRQSPFAWFVQTGTAKSGTDKYTIRRWTPGQSEWAITVLYPDRHLVKVTRHMDDAIAWMNRKLADAAPDAARLAA